MRTLVAGAGVVAQLGVFALAMWLNSEYGHETGKAAGTSVRRYVGVGRSF